MKALLKSELASYCGVSSDTFRRYLRAVKDRPEMRGYSPTQKFLSPIQVQFLCNYYGIVLP